MENTTLTKNAIIAQLTRSPHGKLDDYIPIVKQAVENEPEFMAHLISWNRLKGQIRDSKVALPILSLAYKYPVDFVDNSLAHLAMLVPRDFLRALRFAKQVKTPGNGERIRRLVTAYLKSREANWAWWERTCVQHRASMKELYSLYHVVPSTQADLILFKGVAPEGSIFRAIKDLGKMGAREAAGVIITRKIPFLIAMGALGVKAKEPDLVIALIDRMSHAELINNTKMLERLGIKTNPAIRGAYQTALDKIQRGGGVATLKASVAAEAIEDETLKAKLQGVQERQLKAHSGIEGDWLVLADKSGSMERAIETSRLVASVLAKLVKGKVHLVFFDTHPRYMDVTGKTLEEIKAMTKHVTAGGSTSIGAGLLGMADKGEGGKVDGIAIISDGGERHPPAFHDVYAAYTQHFGKQIPVYLYRVEGDPDWLSVRMQQNGHDMQVFPVPSDIDYFSVVNLVQTMRTNRYGLTEEIMDTPLLTLEKVFQGFDVGRVVCA